VLVDTASRAEVMQKDIVQRSIQGFMDHNQEELNAHYTRPTIDLYLLNKYWRFLTKDLGETEVADLEKAKETLSHYEKIYTIFEYGNDLTQIMTALETRIASDNPSIPTTIYRKVSFYLL
jgi:hypothetical protein